MQKLCTDLIRIWDCSSLRCIYTYVTGLGIYKRKKESKHARVQAKKNSIKETRTCTRKHALIQESVRAKKNSDKKTCTQRWLHVDACMFSCRSSFLRGSFYVRVRVFLNEFFLAWTCACLRERLRVFLLSFFLLYIPSPVQIFINMVHPIVNSIF